MGIQVVFEFERARERERVYQQQNNKKFPEVKVLCAVELIISFYEYYQMYKIKMWFNVFDTGILFWPGSYHKQNVKHHKHRKHQNVYIKHDKMCKYKTGKRGQ